MQYDINREEAKASASSGKIDWYEYLTNEEILPSDKIRMIEPAKFTNPILIKWLKNNQKTIKDHGRKQIDAIMN